MRLKEQKLGYLLALAGGLMWASLGCGNTAGQAKPDAAANSSADHDGHDHEGHDHEIGRAQEGTLM